MAGFDLTGRVALVTGGAQGIGKAACLALAEAGADVAVVARLPEDVTTGKPRPHESVDPVVAEIQAMGRKSLGITADVRDEQQVADIVSNVIEAYGRIDILVNVVGGSWGETFRSGPILELTPDDLIEGYRLNVVTMFMCSVAVAPLMKKEGKGVIVNIASGAGRGASPGQAGYGAAKAGVVNMSMSMASEWGPEIRVNSIALGAIDSPHRPTWAGDAGARAGPGARTALGREGTQEEVAGIIVWLASDAAGYVTGSVIDAHGGIGRR
jgi:7-alpha-hydroxysteroid dehydrogenase